MIIIGITGTLGAGKGTIVDYLVARKGYTHYSVRNFLIQEIEKQGLPVNRDSMVKVGNALRSMHCPSYITDCLFEQAKANGTNAIIESIRTEGEVLSLRNQPHFYLLAVDADARLRYQRIRLRHSETDLVSYEEFIANEQREMHNTDPNKQNLSRCISMADFTLNNNADIARLHAQIEQILIQIEQ